jgi:hypothetical protein
MFPRKRRDGTSHVFHLPGGCDAWFGAHTANVALRRGINHVHIWAEHPFLHRTGNVQEHPVMVVAEVGQIVREVGEVVAQADLEVIAEVARDRRQRNARIFFYLTTLLTIRTCFIAYMTL